jgi:thiamine-phosphate pyrophosphorylase
VTDRRRLCLDCETPAALRCLLRQVQWAVAARVDVVQIRERALATAELAALVEESVAIAHGAPTRVIVNDRLDVALACGAAGVHLRGDSVPADTVRRHVPPGFLVGQSVHTADEAAAVEGFVDYVIAGTVWTSASKAQPARLLGAGGLAAVVRAVRVPVLAIGGVDVARCPAVSETGAAGVAAIGLFMGPETVVPQLCRAVPLTAVVEAARAGFDSTGYH